MTNDDIDLFFNKVGLADHVVKQAHEPSCVWTFQAGPHPVLIQTQASANRMRIVSYIAEQPDVEPNQLIEMLEANYHSALDARYGLADGYVVAAFLHPFKELDGNQFVLGLYQVISCAETFGTYYSGGTMVFGEQNSSNNDFIDFDLDSDSDTDSWLDDPTSVNADDQTDASASGDMEDSAIDFLSSLVRKIRNN